jgi:hypothetical protein
VHVVFDGVMLAEMRGKMTGINKMWHNIVPHMAAAVRELNGTLTHCQSDWEEASPGGGDRARRRRVADIPGVPAAEGGCDDLAAAVRRLPGAYKIVISSYYRVAGAGAGPRVCDVLPIYDFIPERTNLYGAQHAPFYRKRAAAAAAGGFLSLSESTTRDLVELYGVDPANVATSPNRVAPSFRRVPELLPVQLGDFLGAAEVEALVESGARCPTHSPRPPCRRRARPSCRAGFRARRACSCAHVSPRPLARSGVGGGGGGGGGNLGEHPPVACNGFEGFVWVVMGGQVPPPHRLLALLPAIQGVRPLLGRPPQHAPFLPRRPRDPPRRLSAPRPPRRNSPRLRARRA